MREPFIQLYVHLVWSTWYRMPLLTPAVQAKVHVFIQAECHRLGGEAVAVGGVEDHVHVLAWIPATLSVSTLVKQFKGALSRYVNREIPKHGGFRWQGSYGAFTVSRGNVPRVREYVLKQKERHRLGKLHPALEKEQAD